MECPHTYWPWGTQRHLIDVAPLSLLNLLGTKSILPPSVTQAGKQRRADWGKLMLFFFWSGHSPDDKRGGGYAIKISLVGKLASPHKKNGNNQLITMRFPLLHGKMPLYPSWPTRMRQKTSSSKTLSMLSPVFPLQTSSLFLMTLIKELDKTAPPEKEHMVNTVSKSATATTNCFFLTCAMQNLVFYCSLPPYSQQNIMDESSL